MSAFIRTLAKVGLVELDEEGRPSQAPGAQRGTQTSGANSAAAGTHSGGVDEAALASILGEDLSDLGAGKGTGKTAASDSGAQQGTGSASISAGDGAVGAVPSTIASEENRAFIEIYQAEKLADTPFSAEKLLRLLDGLQAMEPAMRKAAVTAMDAADDEWTIEDAVLDAQRKVAVLQKSTQALEDQLAQHRAKAERELQAQQTYQVEATDSIRKQIAELEALLEQEVQKVAETKASVQAEVQAAEQLVLREKTRRQSEVTRLQSIVQTFMPSTETLNA